MPLHGGRRRTISALLGCGRVRTEESFSAELRPDAVWYVDVEQRGIAPYLFCRVRTQADRTDRRVTEREPGRDRRQGSSESDADGGQSLRAVERVLVGGLIVVRRRPLR